METKHTPGPWAAVELEDDIQPFAIIAERQPIGARMNDIAAIWTRGGKKKTEANADLIAAAPDLLAALELIHSNAAESPEWIRRHTSAAIAKAKGQSC